ncbi:hypothetical protein [Paucibacter soli]|uniref:hypothetical protein n=1 Tax=Paucibacter soli TaxID=3133433 RepID=UPI0030A02E32
MLKRLFSFLGGAAAATSSQSAAPTDQAEQALFRQIAERSKTDPLIGAKIGAKDVTQRLLNAMKTDRGVHVESLLCALGSLAGYSCQAALRALAAARGAPETSLLTVIETQGGKTYFFGDHLNKPLAESQYSVWGLAAGGAQQAGCSSLPDINEIFKHVTSVVGTDAFGLPRIPEKNKPQDIPINYVRTLWPALFPIISKFCPNPEHWPILLSLSIQEVVGMGKAVIDPCLALQLVMESAVPMSKVNLGAP